MPISHKYKAIFVHIPKCAGSSIEKALGVFGDDNAGTQTPFRTDILYGVEKYTSYPEINFRSLCSYEKALQHLTLDEIKRRVTEDIFNTYYKFAFVRNPYDRIVAEYYWREDHKKVSFQDFILFHLCGKKLKFWLKLSKPKVLEDHFTQQSDFISDDIQFVGRIENLESDWEYVSRRLSGDAPSKLPHTNRGVGYKKNPHNKKTKEIVFDFYKKDFKRFGYVK